MDPTEKHWAIESHSQKADEFVAYYEALDRDPYDDGFVYGRSQLESALRDHLPGRGDGQRLLDVGCGTGHHLAQLHRRGFDVAGVDASPEMLEYARRLNPEADLREADVEHLPFPDASFDIVLCIEVLRYLRDPEPTLREMARVLKPGGVLLATAAPLFNLQGYALLNRLVLVVPLPGFTRLRQYFTTGRRERVRLQRAGFDEVRVQGVTIGPVTWVARLRPGGLRAFLRRWEPVDRRLADRPGLRELSNMFLIAGVRRADR